MLWTWDKTDAVLNCGILSGVLVGAVHAVVPFACCWSAFLLLWGISAAAYVISAALQVSTKGRAVLITGCDTGFGLGLALHLHRLGFRVFAGCLLADGHGKGAESLRKVRSDRLHVLQLDVTSQGQVQKAVKEVKKLLPEGEELWGLVNNAGLATYGEVEWAQMETLRKVIDVNVLGLIAVTRAFLPQLRKSKGRVVTVTSGLGRMAVPMRSAYVTSKYAAEGFCDVLRYEMRKWGVNVSIVEPGNFIAATGIFSKASIREAAEQMWESASPDVRKEYGREHFDGRMKLMQQYAGSGDKDITPVLNAFTEGLVQRWPQVRYVPMDLYFRTRVFVATHLPEWVYEKLYVG
ncbi:D-beta-hydroxybutyrate dehydrogenase, mitochondrial-like [Eriocheir sinensis]|uniref:D-beta-hydroxybutyrate dehydrogenase, mitochondrial-like n=1 Tax=Eriocheir sinensis TaxID=95602 RepID=UPI0021CA7D15|nr:D-beta-hydroxybutyrate dehydrogenase, mitochondrial-like [Eriocheir sinensis]